MEELDDIILLTTPEVATKLNVSERTVKRLIQRGELPIIKIGRNIRVSKADLFKYVNQKRRYNLECVESMPSSKGESLCDSINVEASTALPTKQVENRLDVLLKPMTNK